MPLANVQTIQQSLSQSMADDRFYTVFFAAFAAVALVLAALGIYGVMSFAVAQRAHEIGVRMALGARKDQVLSQILREGMATALAGTALGVVGAAAIGRALQGMVHGMEIVGELVLRGLRSPNGHRSAIHAHAVLWRSREVDDAPTLHD